MSTFPWNCPAPFPLKRKQILQKLCKQYLKWDEELPKETAVEWIKWIRSRVNSHEKMLHTTNIWQNKRLKCPISDACEKRHGQVTFACSG